MKNNEKIDLEKIEDKYFCLLYPGINSILEKFGFPYKIVRPCPTKIVTYDGKERRADFFGQLDNNDIISLEAHSTAIRKEDKEKFFDYACYMSTKYRRKVHTLILSTHYKDNDEFILNWHNNDRFTIPYKSFKSFDGDKTINNISLKLFTLGLKILIKVTGDHSVIELSYLVCAHSVEALKALVRGDDVDLPGGEGTEMPADIAVELLDLGECAESLTVGWIRDDGATAALCAYGARVLLENAQGI